MRDEELAVRQVDFLIKALLYGVEAPAPLPRGLSEANSGAIALFSLTEYGRWGWYPTFEDTTEYRICLNGVAGRFPPPANHAALLMALRDADSDESEGARRRLYAQLRKSTLYLSFVVPEDIRAAIQAGTVTWSPETPIELAAHDWRGQMCWFAFSDPAYRVTRDGGCMGFPGITLCSKLIQNRDGIGLVINPAGPATCRLTRAEVEMLAQSG